MFFTPTVSSPIARHHIPSSPLVLSSVRLSPNSSSACMLRRPTLRLERTDKDVAGEEKSPTTTASISIDRSLFHYYTVREVPVHIRPKWTIPPFLVPSSSHLDDLFPPPPPTNTIPCHLIVPRTLPYWWQGHRMSQEIPVAPSRSRTLSVRAFFAVFFFFLFSPATLETRQKGTSPFFSSL